MVKLPQVGDKYELLGLLTTHVTAEFGPVLPKLVLPPFGTESQTVVSVIILPVSPLVP
jgi:hypothetical protein